MMKNPKFCYIYVAQPLCYKRDEFCLCVLLCIFRNIKNSPKYPKIEKVTDVYQVLFIRWLPLTVAFHPKNDLIIEIKHP